MGKSCFVKRVVMVIVPTRLYAFFGKRSMLCEKYGWVARKVEGKGGTVSRAVREPPGRQVGLGVGDGEEWAPVLAGARDYGALRGRDSSLRYAAFRMTCWVRGKRVMRRVGVG